MGDTLDILTLNEGKGAINLNTSDSTQDTELASWITGISRRIDRLCGPVVSRTITDTLDGSAGGIGAWGKRVLLLSKPPVYSITTVTEYTGTTAQVLTAESTSSQTTNQYVIELGSGVLRRRNTGSDALFPAGRHNVVVVYTAGRATVTAAVDAIFKQAAEIMLAQIWRREQGFGSQAFGAYSSDQVPVGATFAVPNAVKELLADEMLPQGLPFSGS